MYHFRSMHLCSTGVIKIIVKKMVLSHECILCSRWDLQNWKEQSFNLTIGTEGITQLLKSNFEWSKCKWRCQCYPIAKNQTFFLNMFIYQGIIQKKSVSGSQMLPCRVIFFRNFILIWKCQKWSSNRGTLVSATKQSSLLQF